MSESGPMAKPFGGTLLSIQYLRGIAAMLVVYYHALLGWGTLIGDRGGYSNEFGASGVDIFFVISGFVMCYIAAGKRYTPITFAVDRVTRVLPMYWLVTVAMFVMPLMSRRIGWSSTLNPGHLLTSLLCIGGIEWSKVTATYPVYRAGWTINYEILFYGVFSLCLLLPGTGRRAMAIGVTMAALVVAGLVVRSPDPFVQFYTSSLLLEFCLGVLLSQLFLAGRLMPSPLAVAMLIGGFLLLYFVPWRTDRFFANGIPAALIVWATLSLEAAARRATSASLKLVGDASYSIYLTHLFSLPVFEIAWSKSGAARTDLTVPYMVMAIAFAGSSGIVAYYSLERPLTRAVQRAVTRPKKRMGQAAG